MFTFGDARFFGSQATKPLNAPIVSIVPTPTGAGYWLAGRDGGVFTFGDALYYGSMGGRPLNAPIVDMAVTPSGKGYWLAGADGGVFTFGDATFHGAMVGTTLAQPVNGFAPTPTGRGYWLVAQDGGVFTKGDATYHGRVVWTPPPTTPPAFAGVDRTILAHPNNYDAEPNRGPAAINRIVIHTIEGSEQAGISWFQDPQASASAHYVVAESGRITRMVPDEDVAYHVRGHNSDTIGIEHEGFASSSSHPAALYERSAALVRHLCNAYGIPKTRAAILGHTELDPARKTDPGAGWDWGRYMALINS